WSPFESGVSAMPHIFTFSVPSIVSDTAEARAKGWRELETIMREGVLWFGSAEVRGLLKKITTRPKRGRPAQVWINRRLLEEYDAAVLEAAPKPVNKAQVVRGLYEKYKNYLQSPEAVGRQLDRLLKRRREAEAKKKG